MSLCNIPFSTYFKLMQYIVSVWPLTWKTVKSWGEIYDEKVWDIQEKLKKLVENGTFYQMSKKSVYFVIF